MMIFFAVLLCIQVLASVLACIRERGEDPRFETDKLGYRS
jgi:hypothetical protein